jgi:hypothetical protein
MISSPDALTGGVARPVDEREPSSAADRGAFVRWIAHDLGNVFTCLLAASARADSDALRARPVEAPIWHGC